MNRGIGAPTSGKLKAEQANTTAPESDADLISASSAGNQFAFRKLVERYEGRVASTVTAMLGHTAEAEDVGQETFIRFYRALDAFRGDASVSTYLNRIAINLSLNALKRRKRWFARFQTADTLHIPDESSNRSSVDNTEKGQLIQQAILQLKPEFRAVVVLRLVEGYSTRETADFLNLPIGTVLSRLARAQVKLRDKLRPYYSDENK